MQKKNKKKNSRPSQFTGKGSRSVGAVRKRQMSGFKICISILFTFVTRAFDLSVKQVHSNCSNQKKKKKTISTALGFITERKGWGSGAQGAILSL